MTRVRPHASHVRRVVAVASTEVSLLFCQSRSVAGHKQFTSLHKFTLRKVADCDDYDDGGCHDDGDSDCHDNDDGDCDDYDDGGCDDDGDSDCNGNDNHDCDDYDESDGNDDND